MNKQGTTLTEIAKQLGVSPSTVSRALNDHPAISKATKNAVIKLAKKLNYQPNLLALNLLKKRTNTIGVIVPEITSFFFSSIINGIQDFIKEKGYNMIIGLSNESYKEEKSIVQTFSGIRVDGFLISPAISTKDYTHLNLLKENNIPVVIFDRDCEGLDVDKVFVDEYKGAFEAVEYLIKSGCTKIAHISGPLTLSTSKKRLRGYMDALEKHGIPFREELIVESNGFMPKHGIKPTKKLLSLTQTPDAIFAVNDGNAIGAMYYLKDNGIKIPEEISVLGFDDEPHSSYFKPALSSVLQPTYEMGLLSARILMNKIQNGSSIHKNRVESLYPELMLRDSTLKIK